MPLPVKAIQVDGTSEFEAVFEEESQKRGIRLLLLPPGSPRLNDGVEPTHRTRTEEFYEVIESLFDIAELRAQMLDWEQTRNTVRLRQALSYLTPLEFLKQRKKEQGKEVMCHSSYGRAHSIDNL